MNKKEYISSQQDCASLIGESISEYNKSLQKIKRNIFKKEKNTKEDNDLLKKLRINKSDLKTLEKIATSIVEN